MAEVTLNRVASRQFPDSVCEVVHESRFDPLRRRGIFVMDLLGITDLLPKLHAVPRARRRLLLGLALAGLFFLASVEASLAVLREQLAEADAVLKLSLAGEESRLVAQASSSWIPVVGQATLGFVLLPTYLAQLR